MLTSVRSLAAASFFALTTALATPAFAQEEEDDGIGVDVSANVAIVSEYKFRGVSLSDGDIAVQGGVDLSLPAGFYVGTWASSIDEDTVGYGHTELDIYGGWSGEFGAISTDVGVIMYIYPNAGAGDFDYVEVYGSVGTTLGPVEATLGVAYAPEQDSLAGTDNFYVYGDLGTGIPGTPVSLYAHLGYTDGFLTFTNDGEALDYALGADVALGSNLSIGAAFVGVEGDVLIDPDGTFTDDSVVLTLSASF
ncbi:TorF family putative porin [Aurantiacibacter sp. D1-12]|uniref:TorF family putative porin n=1 Tax=Aurantiacibacter sp. D1-12 TaxID=2993658 RepID=UPI00237CE870|nr:TorF family putative porin [Aurantiacibacter sp. D1-12]MDE1467082.1 TorF family putative porin [Aurantiacibacter sp. D1-12]